MRRSEIIGDEREGLPRPGAGTTEPNAGDSLPKRGGLRVFATAITRGMAAAYRDAFAGRRLAFASPAVAAVAGLILFYGAGFVVYGLPGPVHGVAILAGVVLAVLGMLAGIGIAWSRSDSATELQPADAPSTRTVDRFLLTLAVALVIVGLVAIVLYLVRIGGVPLFMSSVEQGRVEASNRGGSALRVLSLLALPGTWLLIAVAVSSRSWRWLAASGAAVLATACLQLATANRSNAFLVVEVSVLAGLLVWGIRRVTPRLLVGLAGIVAVVIVAAGLVGAYRFEHSPETWNNPDIKRAVQVHDYVGLTELALRAYLIVPVQNTNLTMAAVPAHLSWRLGYTYIQPLLTTMPGHQTTFDQDIKTALGQVYAGGGTVPSLLGESYANFGPPGWFFVPLILGFVLTWLYRCALVRNDPAWWALYAYAIIAVVNANLGGLSVASVFPMIGAAILVFAAAGLPLLRTATQRLR